MLRWPHKQWHRRLPEQNLLGKLFLLSAIAHIFVACLIIVMQNVRDPLHIDLTQALPLNVSFDVVPFVKRMPLAAAIHNAPAAPSVTSSSISTSAQGISLGTSKAKEIKQKTKKTTAQKEKKVALKNTPKKTKNTSPKKLEKSKSKESDKESSQRSKKKIEKIEEIKTEPKKEIISPVISEQKQEIKNESDKSVNSSLTDSVGSATSQAVENSVATPIVIGREDYELFTLYAHIKREVEQVWKPPVGLSADNVCTLMVYVDAHGKASKIDIKESSGVIAYDCAARLALKEIVFPQHVYNKELVITFKQ